MSDWLKMWTGGLADLAMFRLGNLPCMLDFPYSCFQTNHERRIPSLDYKLESGNRGGRNLRECLPELKPGWQCKGSQ